MPPLPNQAPQAPRPAPPLVAARHGLHRAWRDSAAHQRFAYGVAALLIASGVAHAGVLVVVGDSLMGDVSFRKPATFGLSFGITLATLAWIVGLLPRNRALAWLVLAPLGLASLYEVVAVTLQRWRGVPSHFNTATPFDAAIFAWMGNAVALIGLAIVVVTVWSFVPTRERRVRPALAWAVRLGLLLLVAAQFFGAQIIANGFALLDRGSPGPYAVFGAAGLMKLPHFFAMHAVQVLPVLALALGFAAVRERRAVALVLLAALGYAALLAVTAVQMYAGRSPLAPTPLSWTLLAAGAAALGSSAAATLAALRTSGRTPRAGPGA